MVGFSSSLFLIHDPHSEVLLSSTIVGARVIHEFEGKVSGIPKEEFHAVGEGGEVRRRGQGTISYNLIIRMYFFIYVVINIQFQPRTKD